jgi:ribosome-binding protein aMBF1 (putative translation factor)
MTDVTETLRKAIKDCGLTSTELALEAKVSPTTINRFLRGEADMQIVSVSRIATALDLELTPIKGKKKAKPVQKEAK